MSGKRKKGAGKTSGRGGELLEEALRGLSEGVSPGELARDVSGRLAPEDAEGFALGLAKKHPSQETAELARAMLSGARAKEVRRALKKALFLLGQKGFKTEEPPEGESVLKPPAPPKLLAYVSVPDPSGLQMLIAAIPGPHGLEACLASVGPQGLDSFHPLRIPRKELGRIITEAGEDTGLPLIEIDPGHARLLLEEAREVSRQKDQAVPAEAGAFIRALAELAPMPERHPVYALLEESEVAGDTFLLARSPELMGRHGLGWFLPEEALAPYVREVEEAHYSTLVLTEEQKKARMRDIIVKAAEAVFDEGRRREWRRRLEELAYVLAREGDMEHARIALAEAVNLRGELGPFHESRLAELLVAKSIAVKLEPQTGQSKTGEGTGEGKEEPPSLIVKPGEVR